MVWKIVSVEAGTERKYLNDGWEPFAVTAYNPYDHETRYKIWLRMLVPVEAL